MNALDLAKVGKSFGFSVPPRVNVTVGGGTGGSGRTGNGKKRRRDDADGTEDEVHMEEIEVDENDLEDDKEGGDIVGEVQTKRIGKDRRIETLGQKKVDKEVYRKGAERKRQKNTSVGQWSR